MADFSFSNATENLSGTVGAMGLRNSSVRSLYYYDEYNNPLDWSGQDPLAFGFSWW